MCVCVFRGKLHWNTNLQIQIDVALSAQRAFQSPDGPIRVFTRGGLSLPTPPPTPPLPLCVENSKIT